MDRNNLDSELSAHASRNRSLVALIKRKGGDPEMARTIDLHFWSPERACAERLASALRELGLQNVVTDEPASPDDEWNVEGQYLGSVRQVVEPAFVERLIRLANSLDSHFDGWGTHL